MEPLEHFVSPSRFELCSKSPLRELSPALPSGHDSAPCFASSLALHLLFTHGPPAAAPVLQKSFSALLNER